MGCKHLKDVGLITQPVEYDEFDKTYSIDCCCGGGCYIITGIRFCPFCGEEL